MSSDLIQKLSLALAKRQRLFNVTNALRLVNGAGDGLKGLVVDRYNRHIAIQVMDKRWLDHAQALSDYFQKECAAVYIILKDRSANASSVSDAIKVQVLSGGNSTTTIQEYGLTFEVDLNDGLNCGLFLDMRKNRRLVASLARGKTVLNCFAYTCSFGVHCQSAGAVDVTNVDISHKYLKRGEENYQHNGLSADKSSFVKADARFYLERAVARGNRYGLIILDPPSFARHEGKTFSVKKDLGALIQLAFEVLEPQGHLFVSTNYSGISMKQLEVMVRARNGGGRIKKLQCLGQDTDFPGTNRLAESFLSAVLVSIARD